MAVKSRKKTNPNSSFDRPAAVMLGIALVLIALITTVHSLTDMTHVAFHNVYRRLYYIPILIMCFSHGLRGGLVSATLTSAAYAPHAFFMMHRDPSPTVDKILEIVLYLIIGGLTGGLVSRQKKVQQALTHSLLEKEVLEKQLVRAGKLSALGQLTAGLAHEIRNPLASILGSAEALSTEFDKTHRKYPMGQILLKEIHRLNRVVNDFLQFSRVKEPKADVMDLLQVINQVVELTHNQAKNSKVQVNINFLDSLMVRGDPGLLAQVLLNIFLNAYQALEKQDDSARQINLVTTEKTIGKKCYLGLGVRDNGPGISKALMEEIFNPYFTTKSDGIGLGLSISSLIIEAHKGFIDIESQPGKTTVWLYLPNSEPHNPTELRHELKNTTG